MKRDIQADLSFVINAVVRGNAHIHCMKKITIAKLKVSKSGYSERYEPYELIAEACIENWENTIRTSLARSFHFEPEEISLA